MKRPYRVLFLCTGNSARSILAEALHNHLGRSHFIAYSAGSQPTGQVNLFALATLEQQHVPPGTPRSKRWEEFAGADGSSRGLDIIITVCDSAAGEVCPVWPGSPLTAHWSSPDPAAVVGDEATKLKAFDDAFEMLRVRIQGLVLLPIGDLDRATLKKRLNELGQQQASLTTS
jgi:arsenate reductase (thioredoxin)